MSKITNAQQEPAAIDEDKLMELAIEAGAWDTDSQMVAVRAMQALMNEPPSAPAVSAEAATLAAYRKLIHTHHTEPDGSEFGFCRVKFDDHGQVISCLWAGQDEIDAAIAMLAASHPAQPQEVAQEAPVEKTEDWFFTFGGGHAHPLGYVKIHGTFSSAREEMVRRYGNKWSMQYDSQGFSGQAARYGLKEVK